MKFINVINHIDGRSLFIAVDKIESVIETESGKGSYVVIFGEDCDNRYHVEEAPDEIISRISPQPDTQHSVDVWVNIAVNGIINNLSARQGIGFNDVGHIAMMEMRQTLAKIILDSKNV